MVRMNGLISHPVAPGVFKAIADYTGMPPGTADILCLPGNITDNPEHRDDARKIVRSLKPSTGLLCNNMALANILLRYLRDADRQCPEEIGIIGVPYIEWPGILRLRRDHRHAGL